MSNQPNTRQELYDRIKESSKQEVIKEEMVRLGFWSKDEPIPQDPEEEVKRRKELEKQHNALRTELSRLKKKEAMIKEYRKKRMLESRKKQQENKERRIQEKKERAEKWRLRKQKEIVYLGEKKSGGLNKNQSDEDKLNENNLPILNNALDVAQAMNISINELRFLAYSREVSTVSHYIRFKMPKKTGGERHISAPMPRLKHAQYWILDNILKTLTPNDVAHGFVDGRSILSNAKPHIGSRVIINMDLKDFFPSISYKRVKGLFRSFGYSEAVSTILGLICTEADTDEVELDGKTYYVEQGERHLPQGSPASPAITNLICRRLDKRLTKASNKLYFKYTRYADDLTFSSKHTELKIGKLIRQAKFIIKGEDFTINSKKTRIIRKNGRQEVTGIVVNEKPNVSRKKLKQFRALLYQIEKDGLEGKSWGSSNKLLDSIKGYANYVSMVNPDKGEKFKKQISNIIEKYKL